MRRKKGEPTGPYGSNGYWVMMVVRSENAWSYKRVFRTKRSAVRSAQRLKRITHQATRVVQFPGGREVWNSRKGHATWE
jgi:hypothetical protein